MPAGCVNDDSVTVAGPDLAQLTSVLQALPSAAVARMQHHAIIAYQHLSYTPDLNTPTCDAFQMLMLQLALQRPR